MIYSPENFYDPRSLHPSPHPFSSHCTPHYHRYFLFSSLPTLFVDNEIFDLQRTTSTDFLQEASEWQVTDTLTSTKTTICAGNPLLAGYQILNPSASIERTYTISQPHESVFLSFDVYMMGTWTSSDNVLVKIKSDTTTYSSQDFLDLSQNVAYTDGGECISTVTASTFSKTTIYISSAHSGSTLILLLESTTSSSSVTFGIRNVRILISNAAVTTPTQCFESTLPAILNACDCPAGQRKAGAHCTDCHASCETCFGPSSSSCYSCSSNYYYNGKSCQRCSSACTTCSGGAATDCLSCGSGQFLYPSGACQSSCTSPYTPETVDGIQYCSLPCGTTGDYSYEDGICRSTCDPPFTSSTGANGIKYCHNPCGATGDYYYSDGICRSDCDLPFTSDITNGAKFCNYPCEANEYLYSDGSCPTTQCPSCFEVKKYFSSAEYKYCECVSPNTLMMDGSCSEPAVPSDPTEPEPSETEKTVTKLGSVGNTTGVISSVGLAVAAVAMPGDPGGVSAGALTRVIQYSKFLNISYPEKLIMMFKAYNPASGVVSFVPKMSNEQKDKLMDEPIPENFAAYGVHSCFVVNFWSFMLFLLTLCVICGSFLLLERLFKKVGIWVRKVRAILQNFWIVQLYNSSGDIILFSIIQFKSNSWDSAEDSLNFLMSILFLLLIIAILVTHFRTLIQYQRARRDTTEALKNFEKNYECQQIFFDSFVSTTMNQQLFLFYFVVRIMTVNLIIATLFHHPVIQIVLMIILNLSLIIYLLIKRPFISNIDLAQNLSYELILLTVNGSLLAFSVMDEERTGVRDHLAQLIIICSMIFTFLPIFFLTLKAIVLGIQFYKDYKKKARKGSGDQTFEEKVEDLRAQRRIQRQQNPNHLLNSHQGLNIKQPRDLLRSHHDLVDQSPKDCVQLEFSRNNASTLETSNFYQQERKNRLMRNNRNIGRFSPEQPIDLSTTSHYPLNNNSMINYHHSSQNTAPYGDSTLDITLPEDQNERDIEFSPHQNMHVNAMRLGREIDILHQQRPRVDSFERHPFRAEIRKCSGDEMLMESMKTTSKRVTERIRKRKSSQNRRKVSDMSGDDEYRY